MPCPFGFTAPPEDAVSEASRDYVKQLPTKSVCEYAALFEGQEEELNEDDDGGDEAGRAAPRKVSEKDRFSYDKDPVSWFFQNQIKSEEEFQKRKGELREEAKRRLDSIFDKKGKRLDWQGSDSDSAWSVSTNEISEMDSDVDSISSLVSCANSWILEYNYSRPATTALKNFTLAGLVVLLYHGHCCGSAYMASNNFWGILKHTWVSMASLILIASFVAWLSVGAMTWTRLNRRWLLSYMVGLHALEAVSICLAAASLGGAKVHISKQVKNVACHHSNIDQTDQQLVQLCDMLPSLVDLVAQVNSSVLWASSTCAVLAFVMLSCSVWFEMELSYIEKRSSKHKRRRRRRKHQIPWEKIKIIGKVTTCGSQAAPPQQEAKDSPAVHDEASAGTMQDVQQGNSTTQPTAAGKKQATVLSMKAEPLCDANTTADTFKLKAA